MRSIVLGSRCRTGALTSFVTALVVIAFVTTACGDAGEPIITAPPTTPVVEGAEVAIVDSSFQPAEVSINLGETVTWINEDSIAHDIASDDGQTFESPVLNEGDSYSFTFEVPGSYPYHCPLHPFMTAIVLVE